MATNPNQREGRTSSTPQTLNVYGAPKTATPKVTPKPTPPKTSIPAPKTNAEISKVADEVLKQLGTISAGLPGLEKTAADLLKEEQDRLKRVAEGNAGKDQSGKEEVDKETRDAFTLLKEVFNAYGLGTLSTKIEQYMRSGLTTSEARIKLKSEPEYEARFYGNKLRANAGLNLLDEATYLDLENSYSETLKAYGLQDYFGTGVTDAGRLSRQKAIAEVIGKDISAIEFKDRVSTAVERVTNADAATKAAFKSLYDVTDTDLVKYFLDPTKNLQALKEKAAAAEIGGAANIQNLNITAANAEELARLGVTKAQAQQGYSAIAEVLPTAQKLGSIYKEDQINYNQAEAEAETFKGLASAKRKREQLAEKEIATFSGSSGTGLGSGALSTQYLRRGSASGQF